MDSLEIVKKHERNILWNKFKVNEIFRYSPFCQSIFYDLNTIDIALIPTDYSSVSDFITNSISKKVKKEKVLAIETEEAEKKVEEVKEIEEESILDPLGMTETYTKGVKVAVPKSFVNVDEKKEFSFSMLTVDDLIVLNKKLKVVEELTLENIKRKKIWIENDGFQMREISTESIVRQQYMIFYVRRVLSECFYRKLINNYIVLKSGLLCRDHPLSEYFYNRTWILDLNNDLTKEKLKIELEGERGQLKWYDFDESALSELVTLPLNVRRRLQTLKSQPVKNLNVSDKKLLENLQAQKEGYLIHHLKREMEKRDYDYKNYVDTTFHDNPVFWRVSGIMDPEDPTIMSTDLVVSLYSYLETTPIDLTKNNITVQFIHNLLKEVNKIQHEYETGKSKVDMRTTDKISPYLVRFVEVQVHNFLMSLFDYQEGVCETYFSEKDGDDNLFKDRYENVMDIYPDIFNFSFDEANKFRSMVSKHNILSESFSSTGVFSAEPFFPVVKLKLKDEKTTGSVLDNLTFGDNSGFWINKLLDQKKMKFVEYVYIVEMRDIPKIKKEREWMEWLILKKGLETLLPLVLVVGGWQLGVPAAIANFSTAAIAKLGLAPTVSAITNFIANYSVSKVGTVFVPLALNINDILFPHTATRARRIVRKLHQTLALTSMASQAAGMFKNLAGGQNLSNPKFDPKPEIVKEAPISQLREPIVNVDYYAKAVKGFENPVKPNVLVRTYNYLGDVSKKIIDSMPGATKSIVENAGNFLVKSKDAITSLNDTLFGQEGFFEGVIDWIKTLPESTTVTFVLNTVKLLGTKTWGPVTGTKLYKKLADFFTEVWNMTQKELGIGGYATSEVSTNPFMTAVMMTSPNKLYVPPKTKEIGNPLTINKNLQKKNLTIKDIIEFITDIINNIQADRRALQASSMYENSEHVIENVKDKVIPNVEKFGSYTNPVDTLDMFNEFMNFGKKNIGSKMKIGRVNKEEGGKIMHDYIIEESSNEIRLVDNANNLNDTTINGLFKLEQLLTVSEQDEFMRAGNNYSWIKYNYEGRSRILKKRRIYDNTPDNFTTIISMNFSAYEYFWVEITDYEKREYGPFNENNRSIVTDDAVEFLFTLYGSGFVFRSLSAFDDIQTIKETVVVGDPGKKKKGIEKVELNKSKIGYNPKYNQKQNPKRIGQLMEEITYEHSWYTDVTIPLSQKRTYDGFKKKIFELNDELMLELEKGNNKIVGAPKVDQKGLIHMNIGLKIGGEKIPDDVLDAWRETMDKVRAETEEIKNQTQKKRLIEKMKETLGNIGVDDRLIEVYLTKLEYELPKERESWGRTALKNWTPLKKIKEVTFDTVKNLFFSYKKDENEKTKMKKEEGLPEFKTIPNHIFKWVKIVPRHPVEFFPKITWKHISFLRGGIEIFNDLKLKLIETHQMYVKTKNRIAALERKYGKTGEGMLAFTAKEMFLWSNKDEIIRSIKLEQLKIKNEYNKEEQMSSARINEARRARRLIARDIKRAIEPGNLSSIPILVIIDLAAKILTNDIDVNKRKLTMEERRVVELPNKSKDYNKALSDLFGKFKEFSSISDYVGFINFIDALIKSIAYSFAIKKETEKVDELSVKIYIFLYQQVEIYDKKSKELKMGEPDDHNILGKISEGLKNANNIKISDTPKIYNDLQKGYVYVLTKLKNIIKHKTILAIEEMDPPYTPKIVKDYVTKINTVISKIKMGRPIEEIKNNIDQLYIIEGTLSENSKRTASVNGFFPEKGENDLQKMVVSYLKGGTKDENVKNEILNFLQTEGSNYNVIYDLMLDKYVDDPNKNLYLQGHMKARDKYKRNKKYAKWTFKRIRRDTKPTYVSDVAELIKKSEEQTRESKRTPVTDVDTALKNFRVRNKRR